MSSNIIRREEQKSGSFESKSNGFINERKTSKLHRTHNNRWDLLLRRSIIYTRRRWKKLSLVLGGISCLCIFVLLLSLTASRSSSNNINNNFRRGKGYYSKKGIRFYPIYVGYYYDEEKVHHDEENNNPPISFTKLGFENHYYSRRTIITDYFSSDTDDDGDQNYDEKTGERIKPMSSIERQKHLQNSKDYRKGLMDEFETKSCRAQYNYQKMTYPSCNTMYEYTDLSNVFEHGERKSPVSSTSTKNTITRRENSDRITKGNSKKKKIIGNNPSNRRLLGDNDNDKDDEDDDDGNNEDERVRLLASGFWRDVWYFTVDENGGEYNANNNNILSTTTSYEKKKYVLKTMRYNHDYVPRNYDRHRRDAIATSQLTSSPFIVDIYSFCGNSGIYEYTADGDIDAAIWLPERLLEWEEEEEEEVPTKDTKLKDASKQSDNTKDNGDDDTAFAFNDMSNLDKLHIATQVAAGIAAMHNIDKEGRASMAHTDITPGQFLLIDGWYKLNDFNRVRFLRWNDKENKPCGYYVGKNPGRNRSPEEYIKEEQSEKVDIYSMGNIFYMLLTSLWPFEDEKSDKAAQASVIAGKRPPIYRSVWNSNDPSIVAVKEAMFMCYKQNVTERATAREVESYLKQKMEEIDPDTLRRWRSKYGKYLL